MSFPIFPAILANSVLAPLIPPFEVEESRGCFDSVEEGWRSRTCSTAALNSGVRSLRDCMASEVREVRLLALVLVGMVLVLLLKQTL